MGAAKENQFSFCPIVDARSGDPTMSPKMGKGIGGSPRSGLQRLYIDGKKHQGVSK